MFVGEQATMNTCHEVGFTSSINFLPWRHGRFKASTIECMCYDRPFRLLISLRFPLALDSSGVPLIEGLFHWDNPSPIAFMFPFVGQQLS